MEGISRPVSVAGGGELVPSRRVVDEEAPVEAVARTLLILGGLLLLGLVADALARRTFLPRVTLLLLLGILAGPVGLGILPREQSTWFTVSANLALVMIGFLLGGEFAHRRVREAGGTVLGLAVVEETGAQGPFVDLLEATVALDDVVGIVLFSVLLAVAGLATGEGSVAGSLAIAAREVGGAAALGIGLGAPAAPLTGRLKSGEATLEEALGLVLVCTGLAMWLDVSAILAAMVMGGTLASLAGHHERPFHEIESVEWPFLVVFFLLAGASLELEALAAAGPVVVAYVMLRAGGKAVGPRVGARLTGVEHRSVRWLGLALMPQAGVALGLALAAAMQFPAAESEILNVVIAGTVVFELTGPVLARIALRGAGVLPEGEAPGD